MGYFCNLFLCLFICSVDDDKNRFFFFHFFFGFFSQSLDGFALAIAADGRFLYISETVSIYLGLSQVNIMIALD